MKRQLPERFGTVGTVGTVLLVLVLTPSWSLAQGTSNGDKTAIFHAPLRPTFALFRTPSLAQGPTTRSPQKPEHTPAQSSGEVVEGEEALNERSEAAGRESVTNKWWFWAAIGGVLATTVAVIVITNQPPRAPSSTLGNMEAF